VAVAVGVAVAEAVAVAGAVAEADAVAAADADAVAAAVAVAVAVADADAVAAAVAVADAVAVAVAVAEAVAAAVAVADAVAVAVADAVAVAVADAVAEAVAGADAVAAAEAVAVAGAEADAVAVGEAKAAAAAAAGRLSPRFRRPCPRRARRTVVCSRRSPPLAASLPRSLSVRPDDRGPERRPRDTLNVLVIDDDAGMRDLIAHILVPEGHQVVLAESAERGLEQLPFFTFDVAFLDHHLPGMEGLVFGEYLRKNNPHMHIALVTGDTDARLERQGRAHGIQVIHKPFGVTAILDAVAAYRAAEAARQRRAQVESAPTYPPSWGPDGAALAAYFGIPHVPDRVTERITQGVRDALAALRMGRGDAERARARALAGLIAARVLGLKLPHAKDGRSLEETYDALMAASGRRREFSTATPHPAAGDE